MACTVALVSLPPFHMLCLPAWLLLLLPCPPGSEIEREGGTNLTSGVETARMRSYINRYPVPQTHRQREHGGWRG